MRLDWLDDLLAVVDSGSFARAADARHLTQSAFTRRIRAIEDSVGAELFDRSRKPVELLPAIRAQEPEMRALAAGLRRLREGLRRSRDGMGGVITFACQHAITTTVSPRLVEILTRSGDRSVKVRSGNRDECLVMLLSGEVELAVMYEVAGERSVSASKGFDAVTLGQDELVPVVAPGVIDQTDWPMIAYPSGVFLGEIVDRMILPRVTPDIRFTRKAETALTLAALQYALSGIGVAWLPKSMVTGDVAAGRLVMLDDKLPVQELDIRLIRLSDTTRPDLQAAWELLL
ncbi:MAG: LysR family transcriptional regulator [Albidovulum sp.]